MLVNLSSEGRNMQTNLPSCTTQARDDTCQDRRSVLRLLALTACGVAPAFGTDFARAQVESTLESVKKSKTLRVGWATYFPYMFLDPKTRELSGITVDLFQDLATALGGVKVVYVEDSWATLIAGFQANKYDMMMPLVHTPQRAEVVGFSLPITKIALGLAVLKKDVSKYSSWRDLDKPGMRISTTLGSSVQTTITPIVKQAEVLLVKSGNESVAQLISGRADAWANTYDAFKFMQKEQPDLAVVPGPTMGYDRVALAYRKGDNETKAWLDNFVKAERSNGNLLRIIAKYGLDNSYLAD
jgi:cyclohexadienyl dehydratase